MDGGWMRAAFWTGSAGWRSIGATLAIVAVGEFNREAEVGGAVSRWCC